LNRGNTFSGSYGIEFQNAPYVTLDRLTVTGAYTGIFASDSSRSTDLAITNSVIFGNYQYGIFLDNGNDRAFLSGNRVYGIPGSPTTRNQTYGMSLYGTDTIIAGNTVYDHGSYGIVVSGARSLIRNNN